MGNTNWTQTLDHRFLNTYSIIYGQYPCYLWLDSNIAHPCPSAIIRDWTMRKCITPRTPLQSNKYSYWLLRSSLIPIYIWIGGVPVILSLLDLHANYADLHRVAAVVLLRMLQESVHVGREIATQEGVRILLKSLEKGKLKVLFIVGSGVCWWR